MSSKPVEAGPMALKQSSGWLAAVVAVVACGGVGMLSPLDAWMLVIMVLGLAGIAVFLSLGGTRKFELAVCCMLVALPLYSAFVVNVGATVRLSYLFGIVALLVGLRHKLLRWPSTYLPWTLLALFVLAVLASIVLNPASPVIPTLALSGLRGIPDIRPLVQSAQLFLMIALMGVTVSYCRSRDRLLTALWFVTVGGLFSIVYGLYSFVAFHANLPFIELNNAMNSDYSYGPMAQNNSWVGGELARPRSTFMEPTFFGNFLLLIVPLMVFHLASSTALRKRVAWAVSIGITILLFGIAVNSRGALYGAVVAVFSMCLLMRNTRELMSVTGKAMAWAAGLVVITLLIPVGGPSGALLRPELMFEWVEYLQYRVSAIGGPNRVITDWELVSIVFGDHPWTGVGFGNLTFYLGQAEGIILKGVADAGGLYQRLLAETGMIGAALYALFVGVTAYYLLLVARRSHDVQYVQCARALIFWIVADGVQRLSIVGIATDAHLWVGFGLALALIGLAGSSAAEAAPKAMEAG